MDGTNGKKTQQDGSFIPSCIKHHMKCKWFKYSSQEVGKVRSDFKDGLKWHRDFSCVLWASDFASLSLGFLIYKMGLKWSIPRSS